MLDQQVLDIKAQLASLEMILGHMTVLAYKQGDLHQSDVAKLHGMQIDSLRTQSLVKTDDPFLSDIGSDAVCAHVERVLSGIRTLAASVLKP